MKRFAKKADDSGQMNMEIYGIEETKERLNRLIGIGEVLAQKYDVVCTNPPYMGNMPVKMTEYVKKNYTIEKYDLYAVFVKRCREFVKKNGYVSMITQQAWMFLSSFEKFREDITRTCIVNLVQLGAHAFEEIGGEVVQTVCFTLKNTSCFQYSGVYKNLLDGLSQDEKESLFFNIPIIINSQKEYKKIPGTIIAYWIPQKAINLFDGKKLSDYVVIKSGIVTGNNDYFLKLWYEINFNKIGFKHECFKNNYDIVWVPMHKGGGYRKHYGLHDYVMNLHDIWEPSKSNVSIRRGEPAFYFREGLTWSTLSNKLSVRHSPKGFVFDTKGSMCFSIENEYILYLEAFLNSCIASYYMSFLSPTLDFNQGAMGKIPIIISESMYPEIVKLSEIDCKLCKQDWDDFEASWDFVQHPLIRFASFSMKEMQEDGKNYIRDMNYIKDAFTNWENECFLRFNRLKANEEELNRIFIDIYSLQEELTHEVDDKDVTVRKADLQRDIRSLISYAVGCMFGRYSLDTPGLAYAGGEWDSSKYSTFLPDIDNCIPITDKAYFEDDIVNMFEKWLEIVYGADTLEENLDFIANALGNKGSTSREIIRNYFLTEFFKNHCKIYQKRPIYWLFDSGKQNGFKALVYLHRYDENTAGRILMYLQKLQKKYETEVRAIDTMLEHILDHRHAAAEEKRREHLRKQIEEIKEYDERLEHIANEHIRIDLDDGVKVNYEKVQKDREGKRYQILAPIR